MALVREIFYWSTINHDVTEYVTNCHWCHVAKGHYTGSHTQQELLVANNPLDLLCIYFLKVGPLRDGKENILVLTDTFTKFIQAFITNNQKAIRKLNFSKTEQIFHGTQAFTSPNDMASSGVWENIILSKTPTFIAVCGMLVFTILIFVRTICAKCWPVPLKILVGMCGLCPF